MADDRNDSGRSDFEREPLNKGNTEGTSSVYGSISSGLSRSQRYGSGSQPSAASAVNQSGKDTGRKSTSADSEEDEEDSGLPTWARVSLWLLRKSIVPIIMIVMLIAGLYLGFVFLGKGPKGEVFEWSTWRHLYDLIFADS